MTEDPEPDEEQMDRASRIRGRRQRRPASENDEGSQEPQASEEPETMQDSQASQAPQSSEEAQGSQVSQPSEEAQDPQETQLSETSVMERRHITAYLGDPLVSRLSTVEKQVSLNHEIETGTPLGKNRHVRPLIIALGLDAIEDMSVAEIRDALHNSNQIEDPPETER